MPTTASCTHFFALHANLGHKYVTLVFQAEWITVVGRLSIEYIPALELALQTNGGEIFGSEQDQNFDSFSKF